MLMSSTEATEPPTEAPTIMWIYRPRIFKKC